MILGTILNLGFYDIKLPLNYAEYVKSGFDADLGEKYCYYIFYRMHYFIFEIVL